MKAFIATEESQGARRLDEFDCVEGELVWLVPPCGRGRAGALCTCAYTFTGMASHGLTTTAMVRDLPELTRASFLRALRDALHPGCTCFSQIPVPVAAERMLALAARQAEGIVLERWHDWVGPRFDAASGSLHPAIGAA